jgi:hypothetical protein
VAEALFKVRMPREPSQVEHETTPSGGDYRLDASIQRRESTRIGGVYTIAERQHTDVVK